MKRRRVCAIEQAQALSAVKEAGSRQAVPDSTDHQGRPNRPSGVRILFHQDFEQTSDPVNTLRPWHGDRVSQGEVGQSSALNCVPIQHRDRALKQFLPLRF